MMSRDWRKCRYLQCSEYRPWSVSYGLCASIYRSYCKLLQRCNPKGWRKLHNEHFEAVEWICRTILGTNWIVISETAVLERMKPGWQCDWRHERTFLPIRMHHSHIAHNTDVANAARRDSRRLLSCKFLLWLWELCWRRFIPHRSWLVQGWCDARRGSLGCYRRTATRYNPRSLGSRNRADRREDSCCHLEDTSQTII